eukprot:TRINITY_DN4857_c0_g1_i3.p1 TRINITY_DN4857_c0_g1~~TRINITY_DN4857_c0_g1_i3.p1  ORF type:complete len:225 (-),score=19.65 TRINITY_DN4857_c0_g1_i3:670-1344(-)
MSGHIKIVLLLLASLCFKIFWFIWCNSCSIPSYQSPFILFYIQCIRELRSEINSGVKYARHSDMNQRQLNGHSSKKPSKVFTDQEYDNCCLPVTEEVLKIYSDTCGICLSCHDVKSSIRLSCGHIFHGACIKPWFKIQSTCPICRNPVKITVNNHLSEPVVPQGTNIERLDLSEIYDAVRERNVFKWTCRWLSLEIRNSGELKLLIIYPSPTRNDVDYLSFSHT